MLLGLALCGPTAWAKEAAAVWPSVHEAQWRAEYWIDRWPQADAVRLDEQRIQALNAAQLATDPSLTDLSRLAEPLSAADVTRRIQALSKPSTAPRYRADGRVLDERDWKRLQRSLGLAKLTADIRPQWALVVRRAALRSWPSDERVFSAANDTDIDRWQESALFPGTPVAVLHASRDGRWRFVISPTYSAWIEVDALAFTDRQSALDFAARATRVITGASAHLAYSPEAPALSRLPLDMGVALPEWRDWPAEQAVNGQGALGAHVLVFPTRDAQGRLRLLPALLPRSEDSHDGPLPASRANALRQAFKFLGERYGWGHDYLGRDCSGFVSEIYRSLGLLLPRNTSDQARSTAFQRTVLEAGMDREARLAAVRALAPGDLIYLPGHVVMVIGQDEQGPWVIHDVQRGRVLRDGVLQEIPLNGVSIAPLRALHFDAQRDYLDAATTLQRILPEAL